MNRKQTALLKRVISMFYNNTRDHAVWVRTVIKNGKGVWQVMSRVGCATLVDADTNNPAIMPWKVVKDAVAWGSKIDSYLSDVVGGTPAMDKVAEEEASEALKLIGNDWTNIPEMPRDFPNKGIIAATTSGTSWWLHPMESGTTPLNFDAKYRKNFDTVSNVYSAPAIWFTGMMNRDPEAKVVVLGAVSGRPVLRLVCPDCSAVIMALGIVGTKDEHRITVHTDADVEKWVLCADGTLRVETVHNRTENKGEEMKTKVVDPMVLLGKKEDKAVTVVPVAPTITVDGKEVIKEEELKAEEPVKVADAEIVEEERPDLPLMPLADPVAPKPVKETIPLPATVEEGIEELQAFQSELKDIVQLVNEKQKRAKAVIQAITKAYKQVVKQQQSDISTNADYQALQAENKKLTAKLKSITSLLS